MVPNTLKQTKKNPYSKMNFNEAEQKQAAKGRLGTMWGRC